MNPLRYIFGIVALALLTDTASYGGARTAHLQPSAGVLAEPQFFLDYQLAVRKALLPASYSGADFGAVVLPSFTPEWALFLHDAANGHRIIELRVVDGQIWDALQTGKEIPGSTSYKEPIDADVASEVVAALVRTLRGTTHPGPGSSLGLDGVTYHFSSFVRGSGTLSGYVWSPERTTDAGQLVALLETLRKFVESPSENGPANEAEIRKAAMDISKSKSRNGPAAQQGAAADERQ